MNTKALNGNSLCVCGMCSFKYCCGFCVYALFQIVCVLCVWRSFKCCKVPHEAYPILLQWNLTGFLDTGFDKCCNDCDDDFGQFYNVFDLFYTDVK